MSSQPLNTRLTYENLYADFETLRDNGEIDSAREVIKAMRGFSEDEARRMEQELAELKELA